jgi:ubiquinone/menaquinone biosynthesis C-methylase UbiE
MKRGVEWCQADAMQLPFPARMFDAGASAPFLELAKAAGL